MYRQNSVFQSLDWWTILLYFILVFMGWINIYAASFNEDYHSIFDISQKYGKQLMWIGASTILAILILLMDSKFYEAFAYILYPLTIILLMAVLIFGTEVNGARSWISIGSFRLQPAEFCKFTTNLALAKFISSVGFKFTRIKDLLIAGTIMMVPSILVLSQNDTGSALVYFVFILVFYREGLTGWVLVSGFLAALFFILTLIYSQLAVILTIFAIPIYPLIKERSWQSLGVYIGTTIFATALFYLTTTLNWLETPLHYWIGIALFINGLLYIVRFLWKRVQSYLIIGLFLIASVGYSLSVGYIFNNILIAHQQQRIKVLLGIEEDPLGAGYNVNQSKIAIGSGGFSGKGFLQGTQTKFEFVPEQSTDFIFCTVGEEWGFIGTTTVISLFLILLIRLIKLSERQRSRFSRVYGYGVVAILFFHLAINVGMTIGLAPVIGIPLPFFSYGGSSLWGFTFLLFIFLRLDASRMEILS